MIDVRKELGIVETPEPIFIKRQDPDKGAAAARLAITEKMFEKWHADINRTNTRELPKELVNVYEEASMALCKILMYEKEIINAEV